MLNVKRQNTEAENWTPNIAWTGVASMRPLRTALQVGVFEICLKFVSSVRHSNSPKGRPEQSSVVDDQESACCLDAKCGEVNKMWQKAYLIFEFDFKCNFKSIFWKVFRARAFDSPKCSASESTPVLFGIGCPEHSNRFQIGISNTLQLSQAPNQLSNSFSYFRAQRVLLSTALEFQILNLKLPESFLFLISLPFSSALFGWLFTSFSISNFRKLSF